MKKLLFAVFAIAVLSCNNSGTESTETNPGNGDSLSVISPDTGFTGRDTTGLNVEAAQPLDSSNRQ